MEDPAFDLVFGLVDWFREQLEKGLFAFIDFSSLSEVELRGRDQFGLNFLKVEVEVQAQILELFYFFFLLDLVHELVYFSYFLIWRFDCLLGYLFSAHFIKILRNASHQHELRNEVGGFLWVFAL